MTKNDFIQFRVPTDEKQDAVQVAKEIERPLSWLARQSLAYMVRNPELAAHLAETIEERDGRRKVNHV